MFYSHEILTSRKYGVATVWLVATLGSKSGTKKVNKKAILDVDVKKACHTIMQPEAPMALRLQSNLLYGVSRVYEQQCGYVLHDAQVAQLKMRELLKVARNNDLDASTVARPEQLILGDDPAFALDMALPALDFDLSNLELNPAGESQRSTQSMLSIRHRSGSLSSHDGTLISLNIPSSSTQAGAYRLPSHDPFGGSSALKDGGPGRDLYGEEEGFMFQDDLFEFDANGDLHDIDVGEREARRAAAAFPSGQGRLESDSAASGRVRKEHEDAIVGRVLPIMDGEGDFDMMNFGDDDEHVFDDAQPFPIMSGGLGGGDRPNPLHEEQDKVFSEDGSSETAEAPAKRRKPRTKKVLAMDESTELRNNDLLAFHNEYLKHMAIAIKSHNQKLEIARAKKNAEAFVFGNGLNGVGQGIGSSKLPSPLAMFSGASLLAQVTGQPISSPKTNGKQGTKRDAPASASAEAESPVSKRARQDDPAIDLEDQIGLNNDDDDQLMHDSSSGVEIGRDAGTALTDHPSSINFPWNVSASVNSHQRGASSSLHGRHLPGSNSKRLRSASPLIGRGSNLPGELDHFSSQLDDDMIMYGRSDADESGVARGKRDESVVSRVVSSSQAQAEFELFGAAANVDTQTAASSQWVRDALDRESVNFFEFVRNTISEKAGDELSFTDDEGANLNVGGENHFVTFEELFDPERNSAMVAAQAFYHVLSLATKKRVWVAQEVEDDLVPFGEIRIGVVV